ncbi:MAG: ABC transporter permease [Thermoplasmata archaeon]|nr:ABC transporter permease [Thermoplasmata archaeon]
MAMSNKSKVNNQVRGILLLIKKALKLIRGSKLGIAGLSIIFAFAFMAIFAPWLSPYDPAFIAPAEDIFNIEKIVREYPVSDGYHNLVIGPTTPGESSMEGGMWFIMANTNGTIIMDYAQRSSTGNPFNMTDVDAVQNKTTDLTLDITSYGLSAPLSEVLYIAPARGYNNTFAIAPIYGERVECGLLAFIANSTFVILDPFPEDPDDHVLFQENLSFSPTWFNQDTTSAANMLNPPTQRKYTDPTGWFSTLYGPKRFVNIANESRMVTYSFDYCWNRDGVKSVERIIDLNMTVAAEPLAFTFENPQYRANTTGIYVPTENGTFEFFNTTTNGTPEYSFTFNISGQGAEYTAPMGYFRSADSFPRLYFPIGNENAYSVKIFDPSVRALVGEFTGTGGTVDIAPTATSTFGSLYVTLNRVAEDDTPFSTVFRVSETGVIDQTFLGEMGTIATKVFPVEQASLVYALDTDGVVWASQTGVTVDTPYTERGMKEIFSTGSASAQFNYFGSFGGTKYSTTMTPVEMYNMFYVPEEHSLTVYQSIGSSLGALPPGTYASGNTYYLGTDNVGHDILTLLIYGSRVALIVGLTAAFFSVVVGTLVGLVSGYYGGTTDILLMRATDIALSIPFLPIVLIWSQIRGQSIWNIVIILAILGWPGIARVVRAQTLSLKERAFIDAARVSGSSDTKIILKHIAPNVLPFTFLYMTLFVAGAILTEAALSYLALGDPKSISWGNMLSTIQTSGHSLIAPWWLLPPGLCITILSLGFYLLGRGVDEIINPRLRRR